MKKQIVNKPYHFAYITKNLAWKIKWDKTNVKEKSTFHN